MTWMEAAAEWTGSMLAIAGAFIIALNLGLVVQGYFLFLASSLIWMICSAIEGNWAMFCMQTAFFIASVIGIKRWRLG